MFCKKKNKCGKCHHYQPLYKTDIVTGEVKQEMMCIFQSQALLLGDIVRALKGNQAAIESYRNETVKDREDFKSIITNALKTKLVKIG